MIYFLDTNILLRYFVKDNQSHFELSKKIIHGIHDGKIKASLPGIVLSETVWGLQHYQYDKASILRVIHAILALRLPVVDTYDYTFTYDLYSKRNVKFIDCLIASIPEVQHRKASVLSFDKDFKKLGILWTEPQEILSVL